MGTFPGLLGECILELFYPERCAWCGAGRGERAWTSPGPLVAGLRRWDRPHACRDCVDRFAAASPVWGELPSGLVVLAAQATSGHLVRVVGDWKYHGLRGIAWALAKPLASVLARCGGPPQILAPVPLHRRRRRGRGFNQAEVLARLIAAATGCAVRTDLVRRRRGTGQQARIVEEAARRRNVAGAFAATSAAAGVQDVWLVDDLVTSGATCEAAASSLHAGGAGVSGVLCVALAPRLVRAGWCGPVDTAWVRT